MARKEHNPVLAEWMHKEAPPIVEVYDFTKPASKEQKPEPPKRIDRMVTKNFTR